MASTYLTKTFGSSGSLTTWTLSYWIKRSKLSSSQGTFSTEVDANNSDLMYFQSSDKFDWFKYTDPSYNARKATNAVFRDTSAWYHIVCVWDTTNATSSDRQRIYVNGERITSFSSNTEPSLNETSRFNSTTAFEIARSSTGSSGNFDGQMAHVHFIDGTAYDASAFGETDATTGIWKPKTAPSVTYGTNGFFLKFENSGSMGTDSSGNGNNFTVNGTMTQTIDTPSNVFTTWNGILSYGSTMSLANGNTTANTSSSHEAGKYLSHFTSLGMTAGKYYAEFKITSNANQSLIGISSNLEDDVLGSTSSAYNFIYKGNGWGYYGSNGNVFHTNSDTQLSYGNSLANNDILGVALDLDNLKLYFSKNGVWQNSADPVAGTGDVVSAGAKALNGSGSTGTYYFCCADFDQSTVCNVQANFGNGYFGTTPVSSAENPDDGIGIFEYTVPNGFKALCTKSINAQEYS